MSKEIGLLFFWVFVFVINNVFGAADKQYISAVGDPGMRRDELRVAFEAWNFCNEVGKETPGMGSPRAADCFDITSKLKQSIKQRPNTHGFYPKKIHFFFIYFLTFIE